VSKSGFWNIKKGPRRF